MKTLSIFYPLILAGIVGAIHIPRPNAANFALKPRQENDTSSPSPTTYKYSENLGKQQLFWTTKSPNPKFDIDTARKMAQSVRYSSAKTCAAKEPGKCLIGGCQNGMGLYLCNYRSEEMAVTCDVFGRIAEDMVDKWEMNAGLIGDGTDPKVQAYSYWSEDPTWVTMFTMPCLETTSG
ncbi:hypothetical protein TWF281_011195 [Arthrobotrys megalospora]